MKIAILGAGTWGSSICSLLACNPLIKKIQIWDYDESLITKLKKKKKHPKLKNFRPSSNTFYYLTLEEAIQDVDLIIESVTSSGIKDIIDKLIKLKIKKPLIITSKGFEKTSSLLIPEFISKQSKNQISIGYISGPSHAEEVIQKNPTFFILSSKNAQLTELMFKIFKTPFTYLFANDDINGVAIGAALKNPIAIACGLADGLKLGINIKAGLITIGFNEIKKFCKLKNAKPQTIDTFSGIGDLLVTSFSKFSRNYRFGFYCGKGYSTLQASKKVGMAIEGISACNIAIKLAKDKIEVPLLEMIYLIINNILPAKKSFDMLLANLNEIKNWEVQI